MKLRVLVDHKLDSGLGAATEERPAEATSCLCEFRQDGLELEEENMKKQRVIGTVGAVVSSPPSLTLATVRSHTATVHALPAAVSCDDKKQTFSTSLQLHKHETLQLFHCVTFCSV